MDTLSSRLASLVEELEFVGDWTDRYRLLVEWGAQIESLPEADCTSEWEVAGCSSPLWLKVTRGSQGLSVRGASPGILPKALLAVVYRLFDGVEGAEGSASEIVAALDLKRNLSPTRGLVMERMVDRALACARTQP